jgi:Amino acid permease
MFARVMPPLRASARALLIVAYLAGITSIVSALIAGTNSFPRILFNCGREGLLPRFLGKIYPRHRTPHVAIWASLVVAVSVTLGFGLIGGVAPLDYFGFARTLGAIPPYGQNNYRTLGASDVRPVAASPLPFFMKNRLIVFERATGANARLSNRARQ